MAKDCSRGMFWNQDNTSCEPDSSCEAAHPYNFNRFKNELVPVPDARKKSIHIHLGNDDPNPRLSFDDEDSSMNISE